MVSKYVVFLTTFVVTFIVLPAKCCRKYDVLGATFYSAKFTRSAQVAICHFSHIFWSERSHFLGNFGKNTLVNFAVFVDGYFKQKLTC